MLKCSDFEQSVRERKAFWLWCADHYSRPPKDESRINCYLRKIAECNRIILELENGLYCIEQVIRFKHTEEEVVR